MLFLICDFPDSISLGRPYFFCQVKLLHRKARIQGGEGAGHFDSGVPSPDAAWAFSGFFPGMRAPSRFTNSC